MTEDRQEQIQGEDWAGEMGQKWLASLVQFEGMIAPIGAELLARANFQPGESVLDIGFGGGATSIAIAKAVAPSGGVTGRWGSRRQRSVSSSGEGLPR